MYVASARAAAVWVDILVFLAIMVAGSSVLGEIGQGWLVLFDELDERKVKAGMIPLVGILSVGTVAAILKSRGQSARSVALTFDRPTANVALGLVALAAAFAAFYLCILSLIVLEPGVRELMEENTEAITAMLPPMHPVLLLALMGIVGFYEELVFRGFLLTRLRRVSGSWWIAVGVSSALFALPHAAEQQPVAILPLFGLAVVFSLFTIWRKSLIPAIIGHALFNSAQLLFIYYTQPDWS